MGQDIFQALKNVYPKNQPLITRKTKDPGILKYNQ